MRLETIDLLLIYPNNRIRSYRTLADSVAAITPPIQLGLIAGFIRSKGFTVRMIDAEAENLNTDQTIKKIIESHPVLTLIATDHLNSGDVTKMAAASEVLNQLKQDAPQLKTIIEGVIPSSYSEKMLQETKADFVCQGEAYYPVLELLKYLKSNPVSTEDLKIQGIWMLKNGKTISNSRGSMIENLDDLPWVSWDLFPMDKYRAHHWHCFDHLDQRQPYAAIYTNMGCPYDCSFCSVNVVIGKPSFRQRSPENVLKEIDLLVSQYKVKNIRIVDNVFTVKMDFVEHFCDLIIQRKYNLNFWCYARVETMKDQNILHKMKKAGIHWVAYGFEAASESVLKEVSKSSSFHAAEKAIEMTRKAGINIVGNFIFGLPADAHETMQMTLNMAKEYNFEWVNFYTAMAYPGTKLYDYAVKQGIRLPEKWSGYGQYSEDALPMSTQFLSPEEVLKFRDDAFVDYYTNQKYLELVLKKFGPKAVEFIKEILVHKLKRKILENSTDLNTLKKT